MGNTGGKLKEGSQDIIEAFKPKGKKGKKSRNSKQGHNQTVIKTNNPIEVKEEKKTRRQSSVDRINDYLTNKNITFYMPRQSNKKQPIAVKQNNTFFEEALKKRDLPVNQRKSRSLTKKDYKQFMSEREPNLNYSFTPVTNTTCTNSRALTFKERAGLFKGKMVKHLKKYDSTEDSSLKQVLKQNPFIEDIDDDDDSSGQVGQSLPVHTSGDMLKRIYEDDDDEDDIYVSAQDELPVMKLVNRITKVDNDYTISIYQKRDNPINLNGDQQLQNNNRITRQNNDHKESVIQLQPKQGDFRRSYVNKLVVEKIYLPRQARPKTNDTRIIFDWDDTLLSSTCLSPFIKMVILEQKKPPPFVQRQIAQLQVEVIKVIKMAIKMGKVIIVTNAQEGWVECSAEAFMPEAFKLIKDSDIEIISARTRYEPQLPNQFLEWKIRAFIESCFDMDHSLITNIVAVGDSYFEIEAATHLGKLFDHACIKTIKLKEMPTILELQKQLELLNGQFQEICCQANNLTIRLQKSEEEAAAAKLRSTTPTKSSQGLIASSSLLRSGSSRE